MTRHDPAADPPAGVPEIGIGLIGYAFMGRAHSQGWRNARSFFSPPLLPHLAVVAGRDAAAAGETARRFGWASVETDWRDVIARDDVDLVDICTPGDTHVEIAVAALEAGKHVLCEKPLANSVAEAETMVAAAERAATHGVRSMVGFTYRRVPAIAHARAIVAAGRLGQIRHVRAQYLQDWLVDASAPLSWRLQKERAGSGALGDIGAHIVDLVHFVTGDRLTGVSALTETFVRSRPLASGGSGLSASANGSVPLDAVSTEGMSTAEVSRDGVTRDGVPMGEVTVDDAAVFISRLAGGGLATFEATRFATGRKNAIRLEINGSAGSLAFDFEDMNVLHVLEGDDLDAGFTRVVVTEPDHPYLSGWWPPGHLLGYEHGFTHQAVDLLADIATGRPPEPGFGDGLLVQQVLDAVERSAANNATWTDVCTTSAVAHA